MIGKLTGAVDSVGDEWAIIDVNGVGYVVFCSRRTLTGPSPRCSRSPSPTAAS